MEKKSLLVVIDMLNGFINEGPMHDRCIASIIPACQKYLDMFMAFEQTMIAFCDNHSVDDPEFELYPPHCIAGTHESEMVDEIRMYEDEMIVFPKTTTNGFTAESFQSFKPELENYDEIVLVGCCTDICVLELARELQKHKEDNNLKYEVIVPIDACDTFDSPQHSRIINNQAGLLEMKNKGVTIVEEYHYE